MLADKSSSFTPRTNGQAQQEAGLPALDYLPSLHHSARWAHTGTCLYGSNGTEAKSMAYEQAL